MTDPHHVEMNAEEARQGKTGVHLRYVLAIGIAATVIAFLLVAAVGS